LQLNDRKEQAAVSFNVEADSRWQQVKKALKGTSGSRGLLEASLTKVGTGLHSLRAQALSEASACLPQALHHLY
jgi:hypothetical protein